MQTQQAALSAHLMSNVLELFVDNGIEDVEQVGVQSGQDSLRLRVAETGVVLDNARALWGQHQAEIQHALNGRPSFSMAATVGLKMVSMHSAAMSSV